MKNYLKLMRVHHYIKNLLIFLPLIFAKQLFNTELLIKAFIGFFSFSLMSSIVYIINDIVDIEADRQHEKKKYRPLASGKIKIRSAVILAIALVIISTILNIYIEANIISLIIFYGYLVMNILYTLKLKHIPIIDVTILAFGFLFRVLYGSQITNIEISNWLYITILSLSFYLGLGKRRNESKKLGSKSRKVLEYYNESFLTNNMYMFMGLGIVFYSLWCMDINNSINGNFNVIWTIPLVFMICLRYSLVIEGNSLGDPVDVILGDKVLIILALIYIGLMYVSIYI